MEEIKATTCLPSNKVNGQGFMAFCLLSCAHIYLYAVNVMANCRD